tara:strand:+ start:19045 stop:19245 length:201 start_codon:yes stop_codon:yes gene_type:complete
MNRSWPHFFRHLCHLGGIAAVLGLWVLWYVVPPSEDADFMLLWTGPIWALSQVCAGLLTYFFRLKG